ncbi:MAG: right-handed parallel beta-helix repeat-containing protein, partial [Armatimonadetes bacterium]|nr:right-handed parallel beta-helix repeat-containing protein [Armatimonadota bacterium]
ILSSTNIKVLGLKLTESGGDGIYLGVSKAGVTNKGVLIRDVVCERHYRQGISVICAEDLTIEDTVLRDTAGTAPMAGIDFEPNRPDERLANCVMRGCTIEGNAGCGIAMYLVPLTGKSPPVTMRFERCITRGNSSAVALYTTNGHADGDPTGSIEFDRCQFIRPEREGLTITDKPADGIQVRFVDCELVDPAMTRPAAMPVTFLARRGARRALGGVALDNLLIADPLGRQPLTLDGWAGALGMEKITGRLRLRGGDGRVKPVDLTAEQLKTWLPASAFITLPPYPAGPLRPLSAETRPDAYGLAAARIRGRGAWLLYARAGEQVSCTVRYGQVGRYDGEPMPITITAPSGQAIAAPAAAFMKDTAVGFAAPETGVYRIVADSGRNQVALSASSQPVCVAGEPDAVAFIAAATTLWFWVPAGVTAFAVTCSGDGQEGVRAALLDAAGRVVEERDDISRPHQFVVKRPAGAPSEAWQLRLAKPSTLAFEDHSVQMQGIPPLLAASRDALLVP